MLAGRFGAIAEAFWTFQSRSTRARHRGAFWQEKARNKVAPEQKS
jgi:hypothetical protein